MCFVRSGVQAQSSLYSLHGTKQAPFAALAKGACLVFFVHSLAFYESSRFDLHTRHSQRHSASREAVMSAPVTE